MLLISPHENPRKRLIWGFDPIYSIGVVGGNTTIINVPLCCENSILRKKRTTMNIKYFWDDPIENGGLIRGNDFNAQYCFNQSFSFQMIKNLLVKLSVELKFSNKVLLDRFLFTNPWLAHKSGLFSWIFVSVDKTYPKAPYFSFTKTKLKTNILIA